MRRYGGELIYHGRDEEGVIEVVEAHGVRSLHFGTPPRQSSISLSAPERPELPYVRAMLSALLFNPAPQKALLAGLGGGSLARFLLERFPDCRVDAVELRPAVVEVAHQYFGLPRDPRLDVHIADACQYLEPLSLRARGEYDVVMVDAYDHAGMDSSVNELAFFAACARLLHPDGVLAMNLWGSHEVSLKQSVELLKLCFPGKAYRLAVPSRGNVIGLGLGTTVEALAQKRLAPRARDLEFQTGLELSYFLRNLRLL